MSQKTGFQKKNVRLGLDRSVVAMLDTGLAFQSLCSQFVVPSSRVETFEQSPTTTTARTAPCSTSLDDTNDSDTGLSARRVSAFVP
jgi:hypothetical protein